MKLLRILAPSCLLLVLGCETTPDDPLGHYTYASPLRDLLPLFSAWDHSLPRVESCTDLARCGGDVVVHEASPLYAARP